MVEPLFRQAAKRHFRDAQYLRDNGYLANADHLSGFAAECALKGLVVDHLGGRVDRGFSVTGSGMALKDHIGAKLWGTIAPLAAGHSGPEIVALFEGVNPFLDWDVSDRYAEGSQMSAGIVAKHIDGARRAIVALESAALSMNDGNY